MSKWFQAFPYPTPPDRAYVQWRAQQVERVAVDNHEYGEALRQMAHRSRDGFWLLEWDIALSLRDMETLEAAARWKPELLHVVSYDLHWSEQPSVINWNAPVAQDSDAPPVTKSSRSILNCDYPGLGVLWWPAWVIKAFDQDDFWREMRYPDADACFWRKVGQQALHVVTGVHPVHLHW